MATYLQVDKTTNVVVAAIQSDVAIKETDSHQFINGDRTPALVWLMPTPEIGYSLVLIKGFGDVGFINSNNVLITNKPKPVYRK